MKKYKLSKKPRNIVLAIVTSLILATGINSIVENVSSNKHGYLTDEEIAQRNALLDIDDNEEDISSYTTIGYVAEGTIVGVALLSAGWMLKDRKKDEKYNEVKYYLKADNSPIIGSKITKIPCKKQNRRYDKQYRKINDRKRK
ncbi:MAG: hypothetical protein IKG27_00550 [Bacilli bacterium]|nr:hypothetical protein [Bacilli bacterium]